MEDKLAYFATVTGSYEAAAKLAVEDAGLVTRLHAETGSPTPTYAGGRLGCQIGAGLIVAGVISKIFSS
ncbi:MAG: hypothetical protein AAB217_07035, partial [Chloroflexota bacterium]